MKKTVFISDLHLQETAPQETAQFLSLLKQLDTTIDALYILGDLFEYWIGDDDDSPFHRTIQSALHAVAQKNIPVYFMHGNRDFFIGQDFLNKTDCILLPDEHCINLYGTPVLLMHGDTLCTQDHAYQKARRWLRNRFLQRLFLTLPLRFRKLIADKARDKSRKYTMQASTEIMDVSQDQVSKVMLAHGVNHVIHGHTHRRNIHTFTLNNRPATRIVLGSWHDGANALCWSESGEFVMTSGLREGHALRNDEWHWSIDQP
jgi:UDP-2,3-diacylglucosamine hydrolase